MPQAGPDKTIGTTSSQTIDGASSIVLKRQYASVTMQSDGSNWIVIDTNHGNATYAS